jgi:peptide/nickel transport system substrate-binding protein
MRPRIVRGSGGWHSWRTTFRVTCIALLVLTATTRIAAADESELRVGVPRLPTSLDPAEAMAPSQLLAMRLMYEGLVAVGERGDIEPALATSWTVSRDGLIWMFRLRQDVQLHDGTRLGPDDVVRALAERITAEDPPDTSPAWLRPFRGAERVVREVRRGEGASVQIVLAQPYAPLLALLAQPGLAIAVKRSGGAPVGTGPYRALDLTGDRLALEGVPAWRGEPPRSLHLTLSAIADAAAPAGLGADGPLHAAVVGSPPSWAGGNLQVITAPTWRVGFLALRSDRGLTSRKTVRQAVALALDPGLIRPALGQWAAPHGGWLPPGAWAAREGGAVPFDPARARRLLAQIGSTDPTLTVLASDRPEAAAIAEAIRQSLSVVGFRVRVRLEPAETVESGARQGVAEVIVHEATLDMNDPDVFFRRLLATDAATVGSATNVAFFRSPLVDGMLVRASQLGFRPERFRLYQRLQVHLADEVPYVPLYVRLQWMVVRPAVRGVRLDPGGLHHLEWIGLEPKPAPPPSPSLLNPLSGSPPPTHP